MMDSHRLPFRYRFMRLVEEVNSTPNSALGPPILVHWSVSSLSIDPCLKVQLARREQRANSHLLPC